MRTNFVIAVFISLALASLFIVGSGFADKIGQDSTPAGGAGEGFRDVADNRSAVAGNGSVQGSRAGQESSSVIGLVIGSARSIADVLGLVAGFPIALHDLGFPLWFAVPLGLGAQLIVSIGLIQFITGRILR